MLGFSAHIAQLYVERSREEQEIADLHAAMIVGLTESMLRAGNAKGLRNIVFAIADADVVGKGNVVDFAPFLARRRGRS